MSYKKFSSGYPFKLLSESLRGSSVHSRRSLKVSCIKILLPSSLTLIMLTVRRLLLSI